MPRQKVRGPARMVQLGKKLAQVWLDTEDYAIVKGTADATGMALATWLRCVAVAVAEGNHREVEKLGQWARRG